MIEKISHHTDWIILCLFISGLLLIYARSLNSKWFLALVNLLWKGREQDLYNEVNSTNSISIFSIVMGVFSFVIMALSVSVVLNHFDSNSLYEIKDYIKILFSFLFFYFFKGLLVNVLFWLFELKEAFSFQLNHLVLTRMFLAIWLFPLCALTIFLDGFQLIGAYLIIVVIGAVYLYSFFKILWYLFSLPISWYHNILYLCALELLPLWILISWFLEY